MKLKEKTKNSIICLVLLVLFITLVLFIIVNDNKAYNECVHNNGYNCTGLIK